MKQENLPTPNELQELTNSARSKISAVFLNSPQIQSKTLSEKLGCSIHLKIESINPIRSFKGRGTSLLISEIDSKHIVCASAGNFGQGIAFACQNRGIQCTVFVPVGASELKIKRMEGFGAKVIREGADLDVSKDIAKDFAKSNAATFVEDGKEQLISYGAGTMAQEMTDSKIKFDTLLVPLGNGSLLAGVGRWFKTFSPQTKIIGICAEGAPAMMYAVKDGNVPEHILAATPKTIADGIAVRVPVQEILPELRKLVDNIILVSDEDLKSAIGHLSEAEGIVGEPAGIAGLAAAFKYPNLVHGKVVGTLICGSNISSDALCNYL